MVTVAFSLLGALAVFVASERFGFGRVHESRS
jgi:hypothetical protein